MQLKPFHDRLFSSYIDLRCPLCSGIPPYYKCMFVRDFLNGIIGRGFLLPYFMKTQPRPLYSLPLLFPIFSNTSPAPSSTLHSFCCLAFFFECVIASHTVGWTQMIWLLLTLCTSKLTYISFTCYVLTATVCITLNE